MCAIQQAPDARPGRAAGVDVMGRCQLKRRRDEAPTPRLLLHAQRSPALIRSACSRSMRGKGPSQQMLEMLWAQECLQVLMMRRSYPHASR
jgi:hypothetical protein